MKNFILILLIGLMPSVAYSQSDTMAKTLSLLIDAHNKDIAAVTLDPREGSYELTNGSRVLGKVFETHEKGVVLFTSCHEIKLDRKLDSEVRKSSRDCSTLPKGKARLIGYSISYNPLSPNQASLIQATIPWDGEGANTLKQRRSAYAWFNKSADEQTSLPCERLPPALRAIFSQNHQQTAKVQVIEPSKDGGALIYPWSTSNILAQEVQAISSSNNKGCGGNTAYNAVLIEDSGLFGLENGKPIFAVMHNK